MRVAIELKHDIKSGNNSYSKKDAYIFFDRPTNKETASLVADDTMQIEFDVSTGEILYAHGYYPQSSWKDGEVPEPVCKEGKCFLDLDSFQSRPIAGESIEVPELRHKGIYDKHSGWIRIGVDVAKEVVEIVNGTALGISDDRLVSLWLNPKI